MPLHLLGCLLLVPLVAFGLAWPVAARLRFAPGEKLVATAALSLLGVFIFGWLVYVLALPLAVSWGLPFLAAAGLVVGRRALAETWRDPSGREMVIGQALVSLWCVGALSFVTTYSGGGWALDWFEHWERTRFFLEHGALDQRFLVHYPLSARPPLVNVVTGAFLALTRIDFAAYQLVTTLLASFAFLPAALLAHRWSGQARAIAILAVLLLLNPLFLQNSTFAWTKLPAAFFALAALVFFLRAYDPALDSGSDGARTAAASIFAAALAAGLLAHFSVGPYAVVFAVAWLALGWQRRRERAWWRTTALAATVGAAVLATWFAWSIRSYGARETFLSNSSAIIHEPTLSARVATVAGNLRDTLVPHFLRTFSSPTLDQSSAWGYWRDQFFQLYQVNYLFAHGCVAWFALLAISVTRWRTTAPGARRFWAGFVVAVFFLGVATHSQRDLWGLTHICLQALVLLGLALLAAHWTQLGRRWRLALVAGATVDFVTGIALHFAIENYALDRWFPRGRSADEIMLSYTEAGRINIAVKVQHQLAFFADLFTPSPLLALALLGAIFALALRRAARPQP